MVPMTKKAFAAVLFTLAMMLAAIAPPMTAHAFPGNAWQKIYGQGAWGGDLDTKAHSFIQTNDGGYVIVGEYLSNLFMCKIDSSGNLQWNKTYQGGKSDFWQNYAASVVQNEDGSYVLLCDETLSTSNRIYPALILIKTDALGNELWSKNLINETQTGTFLGGNSLVKTTDGGYAIGGQMETTYWNTDFLLIKTDSNGTVEWFKTYGGVEAEVANSLVQTADGGFALAGYTNTFGPYDTNFWLVKTDNAGNMQWAKAYGVEGIGHKLRENPNEGLNYGYGDNCAYSVCQTTDGGYALAGYSSFNWGHHAWLVKVDSSGNKQWSQTFGKEGWQPAYSVTQTGDGGFAVAYTNRTNWTNGPNQIILVKTDSQGQTQWEKIFANIDDSNPKYTEQTSLMPCSVIQTADGALAVLGTAAPSTAGLTSYFYLAKTTSFLPPLQPVTSSVAPVPDVPTHLSFPVTTILEDGTIHPPTSPINHFGNVYTFTGNLIGPLEIRRSNIILEGAGYILQGNGSITESDGSETFIQIAETGIQFKDCEGTQIKNLKIFGYKRCIVFNGSCTQNFVQDNILAGNVGAGITAYGNFTNNQIVRDTFLDLGPGVSINNSVCNLISENTFERTATTISTAAGFGNLITMNVLQNAYGSGIVLSSNSDQIIGNTIAGFGVGIEEATDSLIMRNRVTDNIVGIAGTKNCTISENIIENNRMGMRGTPYPTVNSMIYRNNFINNSQHAGPSSYNYQMLPMQQNTWYYGMQGNFWSGYSTKYPNASRISDANVWSLPYYIDKNNEDPYPLLDQVPISVTYAPPALTEINGTNSKGEPFHVTVSGNIVASQITNLNLASNQSNPNQTISFIVSGSYVGSGFCNMTVAKSEVGEEMASTVYIDGQLCGAQYFVQDAVNYYVWFATDFGRHQVDLIFAPLPSSSPSPSESPLPSPTSSPSPTETIPGLPVDASWIVAAAIVVAAVAVGALIYFKRRKG